MNTPKLTIGGVVVAILLSLVAVFSHSTTTVVNNPPLGGTTTLDGIDNNFVSIGGVKQQWTSQGLTATSSTICSIQNKLGATSTPQISLKITTGILGANNFSVSTSTNTYATSTQFFILDETIPSNGTGFYAWNGPIGTTTLRLIGSSGGSTPTGDANIGYVGPGEYVNFRLATTTGAGALGSYYAGKCGVIFSAL